MNREELFTLLVLSQRPISVIGRKNLCGWWRFTDAAPFQRYRWERRDFHRTKTSNCKRDYPSKLSSWSWRQNHCHQHPWRGTYQEARRIDKEMKSFPLYTLIIPYLFLMTTHHTHPIAVKWRCTGRLTMVRLAL